jgi:predicted DNA-binding antitoxin AbrB/MazE fold protein
MLNQRVDAIYENGVLKPLTPIILAENERVSLVIGTAGEVEHEDRDATDYMPLIADEGDPSVTWDQVQALLAKLPGSLSDDFERERDERF